MKNKVFMVGMIIMVMMLAQFSMLIGSVKAETVTGSDGDVSWSFDSESGTLTFSGSGEITDDWKSEIISREAEVKKVIINKGITSIGDGAFASSFIDGVKTCTDELTSVEIPNGVTMIGNGAFFSCRELTSIEIPNSITSIGADAFGRCAGLTNIKIPDSVTSIGDMAFLWCTGLTSIEVSGNNEKYCSVDGVLFDKNMKTIKFCVVHKQGDYEVPSSVTSIEEGAFYGCNGLTSIKIPNSVTSIGSTFSWWEAGKDFTITIYCKSDSTAKQHAEENNIPYVIDDIAPIITKLTQERFMYKNRVYR